ncbi:MAG: hypothetical protein WCQ69_07415 [Bacteroidales bacterium]|jgi:hypothetical protein
MWFEGPAVKRYIIAHTPFTRGDGVELPTRIILVRYDVQPDTTQPHEYSIHYQTDTGRIFYGDYLKPSWLGDRWQTNDVNLSEAYCAFLERIIRNAKEFPVGNVSNIPMGITVCDPPLEI